MRVDDLAVPKSRTEIFEEDPTALFLKPYMTGDVFAGIPDPDAPVEQPDRTISVAIVGHPCAIRGAGGKLKTRIPCCVVNHVGKTVPYADWPEGNFDLFPLDPDLPTGADHAVRLMEFHPVHKRELTRARRIFSLTPKGVYIFQQRFSHSLTRVAFPLKAYEDGSKHIIEETELEAEWVEELAGASREDAAIAKLVKTFHSFLDNDVDGEPRRNGLRHAGGSSAVRKDVRAEIRRLKSEAS